MFSGSDISKMPVFLVPHPPPRSCQELHLFPGVTYVVNYWGPGVAPSENEEAVGRGHNCELGNAGSWLGKDF